MILGKTKLQSLISKSENIVSVFEKTKSDLMKVSDEIDKEALDRLDQIEVLKSELDILNGQLIKNEKVILNIDKFFE